MSYFVARFVGHSALLFGQVTDAAIVTTCGNFSSGAIHKAAFTDSLPTFSAAWRLVFQNHQTAALAIAYVAFAMRRFWVYEYCLAKGLDPPRALGLNQPRTRGVMDPLLQCSRAIPAGAQTPVIARSLG